MSGMRWEKAGAQARAAAGAAGDGGGAGNNGTRGLSGSSAAPATCEEAHGFTDCCNDNTLYLFENGAAQGPLYRRVGEFYGSLSADEDPSGTFPLACIGAPIAGACDD